METEPEQLRRRMRQLVEGLRRSGLKVTPQRLEVFREVARSGEHPDAEAVYNGVRERMPTVSLDTVYRTLWLLTDLGLVTNFVHPRDRVRFDANTTPHHHFVCRECGRTIDFYSQELDQLRIPESVKTLGSVEKMQVEARGLCLRCSGEAGSSRQSAGAESHNV